MPADWRNLFTAVLTVVLGLSYVFQGWHGVVFHHHDDPCCEEVPAGDMESDCHLCDFVFLSEVPSHAPVLEVVVQPIARSRDYWPSVVLPSIGLQVAPPLRGPPVRA
ncbi:MAG: hypothetical protein J5I41_05030 [Saprospiraceae bacterium]|nr:hypothetical protein [Saprospiraceae bacterium]